MQFISGSGGPGPNEMEVGHNSTERFLVRLAQNEGTVVEIPGNSSVTLVGSAAPPGNIVSNLLQLLEIAGAPLHLTLTAQNMSDPVDGPTQHTALLGGDHPHARGIYPIPEFFFDYAYDAGGPIGDSHRADPLPNLVKAKRSRAITACCNRSPCA